jgi:hypothetical protein
MAFYKQTGRGKAKIDRQTGRQTDRFFFINVDKKKKIHIRGCIQKFPDWPPGAKTANGTPLYH